MPPSLGWGKPLALLAYLAVVGDARRDEVVDLLWRDVEDAKARNAFRQALHRLRGALGDDVVPHDREHLRLASSDRLTIDLHAFLNASASGRVEDAIASYGGDFLHGAELGEAAFDLWAEQQRVRFRARLRNALTEAIAAASARGDWARAVTHAERVARVAPLDPDVVRLAATTFVSAGRRVDAADLLRAFAERTQTELGLPLPPELHDFLTRVTKSGDPIAVSVGEPGYDQRGSRGIPPLKFVGRAGELSRLMSLWQTLGPDSGALAVIEGPVGSGKSRLASEFVTHARSLAPLTALRGRAYSGAAPVPYSGLVDALRPLCRAPGIGGASPHLLAEAARLLPELRDSFDLPAPQPIEDDAARLRFFEGIAALIDAAAFERHVLLVLEDVQHLAPSSLDLLTYLLTRLAGAPAMFVLTMDSDATTAAASRLRGIVNPAAARGTPFGERAIHIALMPLQDVDLRDALSQSAAASGMDADLVGRIVRRAAGNPLLAVESMKSALAGGAIGGPLAPLHDVVASRIAALQSGHRRVLLVLAMLGRPATVDVLASGAHLSASSARAAVEVLRANDLVALEDDVVVALNDVSRDVALQSMDSPTRAFLAGWIADALALHRGPAAELARFYGMAGRGSEAFTNARRAAFDALAAGAVAEGAQLLTLARTFAGNPTEHAEIEGALDVIGSGRQRLPRAVAPPTPSSGTTEPFPAPVSDVIAVRHRWLKLFPNWRILLTFAIATLIVSSVALVARDASSSAGSAVGSGDTLVLSEQLSGGSRRHRLAIGSGGGGFQTIQDADFSMPGPAWVDSLSRPWLHGVASPSGRLVAASRVAANGTDLFMISADRRDSTLVRHSPDDLQPLGWSPDGRSVLLVETTTLPSGAARASLYALRVAGGLTTMIDTSGPRAITEALWSPDGTHIAWVARVGSERQLDVFVSAADGRGTVNASQSASDDYHIAWSPDGDLLAFTSTRDGNPELYAADLLEHRLWRLTDDPANDDFATFSPSGHRIAFESTRNGFAGVYVMPALGGEPTLVGNRETELVGWRSPAPRFVDRLAIDAPVFSAVGDSVAVRVRAFDRDRNPVPIRAVRWSVLDSSILRLASNAAATGEAQRMLIGQASGIARVVVNVGGWQTDTAFVRIGAQRIVLIDERFADDFHARWRVLGDPAPRAGAVGALRRLIFSANPRWDSGILSRSAVPVLPSLEFHAALHLPPDSAAGMSGSIGMSLVAPEDPTAVDSLAPEFLHLASASWSAETGRMVYSAGRDVYTESLSGSGGRDIDLGLRVEPDTTVTFLVDGTPRWRSTLRLNPSGSRAHAWISAHGMPGAQLKRVLLVLLPQ